MDQWTQTLIVTLIAAVVPASVGLALWIIVTLRKRSDQPLFESPDGGIDVPVRQLERRSGFFGRSRNGLNPRLQITQDGLRFKIFKRDYWAFTEIAEVDVPPTIFGTRLAFRKRTGERLYVDLANKDRARDLLQALPDHVAFTQRAHRFPFPSHRAIPRAE